MRTLSRLRTSREGRRGQSLVEFALVIPVFLVMLIAIFDLGRAVFAYNSVTNAAREGVRLAIVNQNSALVIQRAVSQSSIAEAGAPNVVVTFYKSGPNADYKSNSQCAAYNAATNRMAIDCIAEVTFETTYQPITPIVAAIVFKNGVTFKATSVEPVEFVCPNVNVVNSANCPKQP